MMNTMLSALNNSVSVAL